MKVAVTGAAGHIGAMICRELIDQGHDVVAFIYRDDRAVQGLPLTIVKGDILEASSVKTLLTGCDAVIHTAGLIELGYSFNKRMHETNVTGTKNLLEVAKELGVKKIVHFSSVHVFEQKPHDKPVDENRPFVSEKSVNYDQTKRDGHVLALEAAKNGQDVVVVCPTSVVGPPDHKVSKVGKAIIDIYKGNIPASVKGGFDFVDVRDVAKGAILAMHHGKSGESYILGGQYLTVKGFSDLVLEAKGSKKRMIELPLFLAYVGLPFIKAYSGITKTPPLYDKTYIDILQDGNEVTLHEKAKKELGYNPRDVRTTFADAVEWFKANGRI